MAIVFAHDIHIFISKSTQGRGGGGSTGLGNIPKKNNFFFWVFHLWFEVINGKILFSVENMSIVKALLTAANVLFIELCVFIWRAGR